MADQSIRRKQIRLPQSWHWIERVRTTVSELLTDLSEEARDSARIVASELAENVVKYGEPVDDDDCGEVVIEVDPEVIRIRAVNGLSSPERAQAVLEHIDAIRRRNPLELYSERLQFLMDNPGCTMSQLGLLRIAFECEFTLSAQYEHSRLSVTAERRH